MSAPCGRCGKPADFVAGYFLGEPICADCDEQQGWPAPDSPPSPAAALWLAALAYGADANLAAIVADFRRFHRRYTDSDYDEATGQHLHYEGCEQCDHESWPCPTIALCDAHDALSAAYAAYAQAGGAGTTTRAN